MSLTGLIPVLAQDPAVAQAISVAPAHGHVDIRVPSGARPPLVAALSERVSPVVVVTATGREAENFASVLGEFINPQDVAVLQAWETLPHERLSPRSDTVAKRISVFQRLAHPETSASGPIKVLIAPIRSVMQPVIAGIGDREVIDLAVGMDISMDSVIESLVDAAYTRTDLVERRGEFAVRGGLLDIFIPTEDHPCRIEFFGDTIEEIRWFTVSDQRTHNEEVTAVHAPPCRELPLTDAVRARARALIPEIPAATDMLDKIADGIAVEGMESLAPVLVDDMVPMLECVPPSALVVISDPERVRRRAGDLVATTDEFLAAAWTASTAGGGVPIDLSAASFYSLDEVREQSGERGWWQLSSFGVDVDTDDDHLVVDARDVRGYHGDIESALKDMTSSVHDGWSIVVTAEGSGSAKRLADGFREAGVPVRLVDSVDSVESGLVLVTTARSLQGFTAPSLSFAWCTEEDITGRSGTSTKDMRRLPSKRRGAVDPLQLRPGDLVVHEQHGVGRFLEMVQRTVGTGSTTATREYLVIEYAPAKRGQPGDRLYVPTDSLDQVTKYVGGEGPTLNRLGGADWVKTKNRARKAVRQIAGELIRLYSARMASPGFAYSPDTPWQRELEDAFPYVETPDQVATIDEVKLDMEKAVPMDRLVAGDVGYGKTEIAVRAAFKAVQDGKQVAILVPTTLLVQQHFDTFSERYAGFPVVVKALSRFQSDKEAQEIKDGLLAGTVDVVIGTHRLITGEVKFKDLGLVIIDEEQRFGVEHKETLKQLRTNVDVLAMSATPIPRTLEMAVTGIREMSTLATPPEERHPILTYVGQYEEKQIAAAIRRELLREGQVFYVHNRVTSIERAASRLRELVPEARIETAHGKMSETRLEQVITDFWNKRIDVLVCTTIVETGLDVSNANTLIVERSDVLGLSQLHQLRGRVGRGRERAYAYFFYPPEAPLTETAHDRLATIASNTELGAGMAIALKDLEIRGAGNLLGGEQSGHIAGVGFDLYIRMVSEAVTEFRGEKEPEPVEMKIELPIDAHIPHEYIDHERLRLEAYKKLADVSSDQDAVHLREELVDRYGELPEPVELLFGIAQLRMRARELGLTEVVLQGKYIRFAPIEPAESTGMRLKRLYPGTVLKPGVRTILIPTPVTARVGGEPLRDHKLIEWVQTVMASISQ